jgi:hypothetical protein
LVLLLGVIPTLYAAPADPSSCAPCHPKQFKPWVASPMARALERPANTGVLRKFPELRLQDGPYTYRIHRRGDQISYSVTDGARTIQTHVHWIFGQGVAGQTYVLEYEGSLYESRVSYYAAIQGLARTMGAEDRPQTLLAALGRLMSEAETKLCFNCHAVAPMQSGRLVTDAVVPGVQCETCHGPALDHAAGMARGDRTAAKKINGLTSSAPEEMNDLCGSCHRTWEFVAANGPHNILNVRFQPYRITKSKCYDPEDRRIACSACHDPHAAPSREAASYDPACRSCHGPSACKVGKDNCSTCHMPEYELPQSHFKFTDHFIRVVKPGASYPN